MPFLPLRGTAAATAVALVPLGAWAVDPELDDGGPPTPTETTTTCTDGRIWAPETGACVAPADARLDDETRYRAARELAHLGRPDDAVAVLDSMAEGHSDRVLTYLGFAHRKAGRVTRGMSFYPAALARNPDNIAARSYMGQALILAGDRAGARTQLTEIRRRGGRQTWAEVALAQALRQIPASRY